MNAQTAQSPHQISAGKAVDSVQQELAEYASGVRHSDLPAEVAHTAKARIIDTLGILIGGFFAEPCRMLRDVASRMPGGCSASVIGTRMKAGPAMAALVNATTSRYLEFSDVYHWPGSTHGHPSDVVTPVLAAAEHCAASGRDFITGVVVAYEAYCRIADKFHNAPGYDNGNFACIGSAMGAAKVLGLTTEQTSHCISMAVVPNAILRQVRADHLTMWKEVSAGYGGRAGVFAALLARAGMEGPHLPFEGKAGWCEHIAHERFALSAPMGGRGGTFKILDTNIRQRPCVGVMIPAILAAEKIAPLARPDSVQRVTVETFRYARELVGVGEQRWNPASRETADHSIPYVIAATLLDGRITTRSFDDTHLWNPRLRALLPKIEVLEDQAFTRAYARMPREHHARVTVLTSSGERMSGVSGGDADDMSNPKTDAQIEEKFRELAEDCLGARNVRRALDRLWQLDKLEASDIPSMLVLD